MTTTASRLMSRGVAASLTCDVPGRLRSTLARYAVPGAALVAVLARLPFVSRPLTPDESGFLLVGAQWHTGGTSLYGDYWVDRPPLLVTIFRVAAALGGTVPLRLIGCLATALVVLGAAHVACRIAGSVAARWTALTAAALCVSPLLGGLSVNGELLSAPFVVGGMAATLAAMRRQHSGRATRAAYAAGAGGAFIAALLIKQNIADVGVFSAVVVLLAWRRRELNTRHVVRFVAAGLAGGALCLSAVAAWTALHGTSLTGVFDAMYPFRVEADRVIAAGSHTRADARLWLLVVSWLISGGAVIMAVLIWALISGRLRGTGAWALIATVLFDMVSVGLGGSYWNHYLVQLVVPMAVAAGLLVARGQPGIRTLLSATAVASIVSLSVVLFRSPASLGTSVGDAVAQAARRSDTIVTVWGHADVTRASALPSPYPYLWSLPARTLDPRLTTLDTVLAGPQAPTWLVSWSPVGTWAGERFSDAATRLVNERYRPVATLHGRTIYLRNGVQRPAPHLTTNNTP